MKARALSIVAAVMVACAPGAPDPIAYDSDACAYCRMQISDPRFGAELVTSRGKTVKFDSIECLLAYYEQANAAHDVASVWVSDFRHPGQMLSASTARFVNLGGGRSPMGRGLAAVSTPRDAAAIGVTDSTDIRTWGQLR